MRAQPEASVSTEECPIDSAGTTFGLGSPASEAAP